MATFIRRLKFSTIIPAFSVARTKFSNYLNCGWQLSLPVSLMSHAHCDEEAVTENVVPIQYAEHPLSHQHLIRQACTVSVNATTQLLTQTLTAIVDASNMYQVAVEDVIKLLNESIERTINNLDQKEVTDLLVAARAKASDLKKKLLELNSLMDYVQKLVKSTADTAFVAGAEVMCNAMSDRLHSALQEIAAEQDKVKRLEEDCLKLQQTLVYETAEKEKKKQNWFNK